MNRNRYAHTLIVLGAALTLAAPAAAGTHRVSGKQIPVDEAAGTYKMRGGLVGSWTITSFKEIATSPLYHARGTEKFKGCIDRRRDRSCKGDPAGTLSFTFDYWALFASADSESVVWGACWHPIVSGSGDFAGAEGVMQMLDTPVGGSLKTELHRQRHAQGPWPAWLRPGGDASSLDLRAGTMGRPEQALGLSRLVSP